MRAVGKEALKIPARICNRAGVGNSGAIKSERAGLIGECSFQVIRGELERRVQKSRST
jgi:hypothetical protein